MSNTVHRTYKYRLYPTKTQVQALEAQLDFACDLYNAALHQHREAYRLQKKSFAQYEQALELTEIRREGLHPIGMNSWCQQEVLARLHKAFRKFSIEFNQVRVAAFHDLSLVIVTTVLLGLWPEEPAV